MSSKFGQIAATSQFFLYGKKHFTRTGWERLARAKTVPRYKLCALPLLSCLQGECVLPAISFAALLVAFAQAVSDLTVDQSLHVTQQELRAYLERHSRYYEKPDIMEQGVDLSKKVFIVTGANAGVGREVTSRQVHRPWLAYQHN
eukprot:2395841-Amphidinium_carterae.1